MQVKALRHCHLQLPGRSQQVAEAAAISARDVPAQSSEAHELHSHGSDAQQHPVQQALLPLLLLQHGVRAGWPRSALSSSPEHCLPPSFGKAATLYLTSLSLRSTMQRCDDVQDDLWRPSLTIQLSWQARGRCTPTTLWAPMSGLATAATWVLALLLRDEPCCVMPCHGRPQPRSE